MLLLRTLRPLLLSLWLLASPLGLLSLAAEPGAVSVVLLTLRLSLLLLNLGLLASVSLRLLVSVAEPGVALCCC